MQHHRVAVTLLVILTLMVATIGRGSIVEAVEVPPAAPFVIQTSGPNRNLIIGDWYTNPSGANGSHYFTIHVPCSWPITVPIHIDLYHPDVNTAFDSEFRDEIVGTGTVTTVFEIYGVGTSYTPTPPTPGSGIYSYTYSSGTIGTQWHRFYTINTPTCGTYVLRTYTNDSSSIQADNSWGLRVGWDGDANPNNAPPSSLSNYDNVPGTGDEIAIGILRTTFQHGYPVDNTPPNACLTLYEYVAPGQSSVTFRNFDMDASTAGAWDGNAIVRYYSPLDTYSSTGSTPGTLPNTASGGTAWANDTITSPVPGWWRIVSCVSSDNQFIQEGQTNVLSYMSPPPAPNLTLSKTDGVTVAAPGDIITYTLTFTNTGNPITSPGAAYNVVLTDTLPAQVIYINHDAPNGILTHSSGTVVYTRTNQLNYNETDTITITVQVDPSLTSTVTFTNTAVLDYQDGFGNQYPQVQASDSVTINQPNIVLSKTDGVTTAAPGQTLTYTLTFTNTGLVPAHNITISDTLPVELISATCTPGSLGGTCTVSGSSVTYIAPTTATLGVGQSSTITITAQVPSTLTSGATLTNTATLDYTDSGGNAQTPVTSSDTTRIPGPTTVDLIKQATLVVDSNNDDRAGSGDIIEYTIVMTNTGSEPALLLTIADTPDVNTTLIVGSVLVNPSNAVVVSGNNLGDTTVEVTLNELAISDSLTITFRVQVNTPLPDNVSEIANQAIASGVNISSTPSDDPTTTVPDDPTRLRTPPPGGPPTAIVLTEFRLVATSTGWDILWSTGAEVNTRGFLIYRSTAGRDKAQLLTPIPIPARGSSTSGASYRFSDQTALAGIDYSYWLIEIELDGTLTEYGPLQSHGTISQQHRYFIPLIGR